MDLFLDLSSPWEEKAPLAPLTTLGVGGPAQRFTSVYTIDSLRQVLRERDAAAPLLVLGGGSNIVVSDEGFSGDVIQMADYNLDVSKRDDRVSIRAGAGVVWDELVAFCVAEGFVGLEALSGIPGTVGAAPIQNIGAYGVELSRSLVNVSVMEIATGEERTFANADCGFKYRFSNFKGEWRGKYIVTGVELELALSGSPLIAYDELARMVQGYESPSIEQVRAAVLKLRRRKGMLISEEDRDSKSAGSFFLNPILSAQAAAEFESREAALWQQMPKWPAGDGVKLSAAWLIQNTGFTRGQSAGGAAISSKHVLAIVNSGAAKSADILELAATIRSAVHKRFGIKLVPEPTFVGFDEHNAAALLDQLSLRRGHQE